MYYVVLPFNCVDVKEFDKFIKAIGQHDPRMKTPTFYEVKVTHLKKEVKKADKIVEEHKVQRQKFGCSIMMGKLTTWNEKMIIDILMNSLIGSVFLSSVDATMNMPIPPKCTICLRRPFRKLDQKMLYKLSLITLVRMLKRVTLW